MKKIEITIDGKAYPCRQTMGAMLRFKQETGKEATEMQDSFSDLCVFLWCCVASACKRDGIPFTLSFMEFADSISPEEMVGWADSLRDEQAEHSDALNEKKSLT